MVRLTNTKHSLVIQTMAKDEDHIINEWIIHNILLGIDHIYIYDDNSKIPISQITNTLPNWISDKITIYSLEENDSTFFHENFINSIYYDEQIYEKYKEYKQIYFMNYFLKNHRNISEWCLFCDCDEFLYLNDNVNICDLLKTYDNYNIIYIPWLMYGSSYHIDQPKGLIMENFTYHENKYYFAGKSIAKLSEIKNIDCVHEIYNSDKIFKFNYHTPLFELPVHLNHYIVNSIKTYLKRKLRPNLGQKLGNMRNPSDFFNLMANHNEIKTNIMDKYIKEIRQIMNYYTIKNNECGSHVKKDISHLFYCNNKYIYNCISYDILYEMLNSDNLRYCTEEEEKNIIYKFENTPEGFDIVQYKELNQDLKHMTNVELKYHYEYTGYKENRVYKIENIPEDFDIVAYKIINYDLKDMTDIELIKHYNYNGYRENRKYKFNTDKNTEYILKYYIKEKKFSSSLYKFLNPDLDHLNSLDLISFFNTNNNNRLFYLDENILYKKLPHDFCLYSYKKLNSDLHNLNSEELITHYLNHGKIENRKYIIYNNNDSTNLLAGNCVIFINHISETTGAPIFLYNLVIYLQENNIFNNILILDSHLDKSIEELFYNKLKIKPIYHLNNINLLNELLIYYNPIFIYSNSINIFVKNLESYPKHIINKSIFHFHETISDIPECINFDLIKNNKIYFVSNEIREQFLVKYNFKNVYIFKPFIITNTILKLENSITNRNTNIFKTDKIIFGMVGTKTYRKGYDIFINIVKNMTQYIFVWVGDNYDYKNEYPNYIQIPATTNPYEYMRNFDYFLLTSRQDPNPFVVIESIYLNIPCIVLDKNITYKHTLNEKYYTIQNHDNNYENIIKYINNMNLSKNTNYNEESKKYIKDNFVDINTFNKNNKNTNIVLICSLKITEENDFLYYKNLLQYIYLMHNMNIYVVIIAITDNIFNNCYDYISNSNYKIFGLDKNVCIDKYSAFFDLPYDDIIFCPNKGYDVGPFLIGLNFCFEKYEYVLHIHSKNNKQWRQDLFEICNYDIRNFNVDTIESKKWQNYCDNNDNNIDILNSFINILPRNNKINWFYNGGKVFSTKMKYLEILKYNFKNIYYLLTDINKDDIFWKNKMLDIDTFNLFYDNYKNCVYNSCIDYDARNILIKTNSKNFFELKTYGYKGIPDFQIEHALERYIGYLYKDSVIMRV